MLLWPFRSIVCKAYALAHVDGGIAFEVVQYPDRRWDEYDYRRTKGKACHFIGPVKLHFVR